MHGLIAWLSFPEMDSASDILNAPKLNLTGLPDLDNVVLKRVSAVPFAEEAMEKVSQFLLVLWSRQLRSTRMAVPLMKTVDVVISHANAEGSCCVLQNQRAGGGTDWILPTSEVYWTFFLERTDFIDLNSVMQIESVLLIVIDDDTGQRRILFKV